MKTCTVCGATLPATPDNFYRHARQRSGLMAMCKQCSNNRKLELERGERVAGPMRSGRRGSLPCAPLRPLIEREMLRREVEALASDAGVTSRLIRRKMREDDRISVDAADRLCIALGTHLSVVYGFDDDVEAA